MNKLTLNEPAKIRQNRLTHLCVAVVNRLGNSSSHQLQDDTLFKNHNAPIKMSKNLVMHSFIFYLVEPGCTFRNNERAIQIFESPKSVTIKNCSFIGNEAMHSGKDLYTPNFYVGNEMSD